MKTVFLGTPQFAVPSLDALHQAGHDILAVYTQPDRPKGRGQQTTMSPVKERALALGLPVEQPERIRRPEAVEHLGALAPDLMVVVGYGQIIPQSILDIPPHGILNVHASLLPKYRGAAPIQWAIANEEAETGVTIMRIDAGLDTGDMLLREATPIEENETAPRLGERLSNMGAALLIKAVDCIQDGTANYDKQNASEATLAPILRKEDGLIDWSLPASRIAARLHGFIPWPGAYTIFRGQVLNMVAAHSVPAESRSDVAGTMQSERRRLLVASGGGTLLQVDELQLAGRKRMTAEAFVNGYQPKAGERLGLEHVTMMGEKT